MLNAQLEQIVSASALLGYLNFSDGRPDPRWQKQLNDAYAFFAEQGEAAPWEAIFAWLSSSLRHLHAQGSAAFRDVKQAEEVLESAKGVLLGYRRHHADLLAHLDDRDLFGPFFLARVFEAVLAQRASGPDEDDKANAAVIARLNDFVGHRPIAILETRPQGEPYDHERHRPLPLYLKGASVAYGPYHDLIARALDILKSTDSALRVEAQFDFDLLDELAVDLRAYDHGHPVNRRPNYVFGEWDPHHLDNQGRFRRYVVRKITLDALMDRINTPGPLPRDELLMEGAAVLAGTLLMATGISGYGPTAHDSTITLATLLPRIARYRDVFYEHLLKRLEGQHAARLREEQATTRQAFGGARQHLNGYLARHRAMQLQQRYLALLFAEMSYPEASRAEARLIPAVSVRLLSEILSQLTSGQVEAEQGRLREAARRLPEIEDLMHRGIACGAFVDPWNILGFQGLFPLSPAREDSIRDPRVEELIQVVEQIFTLYARLMSEAAASGDHELVQTLTTGLRALAEWWDRFATIEVGDVRRLHGGEAASSAASVADVLSRWHEHGEASADLAFWRRQLNYLRSPKAFALVVDTLLRKADYRSALGLLCSWLSQVEQVPLEDNVWSFHTLALRWMLAVANQNSESQVLSSESQILSSGTQNSELRTQNLEQRHELIVKFFDYLEANAEDYWHVPELELPGPPMIEEKEDDLFGAAYEDVTYQDTTDSEEGEVADGGPVEEFDLEPESDRLEKRLHFLSTLARLWQIAARTMTADRRDAGPTDRRDAGPTEQGPGVPPIVSDWLQTARSNQQRLLALLDAIHTHPLREPTGEYDSLVEYDRRRVLKEQLLFTTINACLDTSLAVSALSGAAGVIGEETAEEEATPSYVPFAVRLERALFAGEAASARAVLPAFVERFQSEPLLFAPLSEGGTPRAILRVRVAQTVLRALLANLPRLGLLRETYDLLRNARAMEQAQPMRGRGVTEFNHFFQSAYQAVVESIVESAPSWGTVHGSDEELVAVLERLTAPFLTLWIEHSRSLQLSVLETLTGESEWRAVQAFVQRYGADLFHARFMTLANLRGILHRGVGAYLDYLQDNPDPLRPVRLLDELDRGIRREDAIRRMEIVLQAVIENYEEYKDYNTTTTQSDYGENLHVLLEFLRLKVAYERHAWQFRPLVLAHEVLARRGRTQAAILWEQSLTRVTRDLARRHLEQLDRLERVRGMRLNTIRDRLNERFIKPLALDRLCALIEPAMREASGTASAPREQGDEGRAFQRLRRELQAFTATPMGVGLDVPYWLRRLEMEVHRVQATRTTIAVLAENFFRIPRRPLSWDELQCQLGDWDRPTLPP
ncbi:MAG TPA: hypothetical protein VE999_23055 [Gemmataceae bacterium]|nr:hypothetical protein [Gemmataceae bacterium]